jgi:hypothetical protein
MKSKLESSVMKKVADGLLKSRFFRDVCLTVKPLKKLSLISAMPKNAGLKLVWSWGAQYGTPNR